MAQDHELMPQPPQPHPALRRLDRLVGMWELRGHTLDANDNNITGQVVIEWLPGGLFMQQRGEMDFMGFKGHSLEIIGYDPSTDTFPATVYSNMGAAPASYHWDVQGDIVTHWTKGSKYTGKFSDDGNTLAGGWRPDSEAEASAGSTYDAVMIRII